MQPLARLAFFAAALALSGCAFQAQSIAIQPTVDIAPSKIGKGSPVFVNVVDERPKKTLGTVGARNVGADITIDGDVSASVKKAVSEGLTRLSFKTIGGRIAEDAELRVEIRNLDYNLIVGFWVGTLRIDTGLKAICIRNGLRPYERLHNGEFVESVQVVQGQQANVKYVNLAMSAAVNSMLADNELMECLSR